MDTTTRPRHRPKRPRHLSRLGALRFLQPEAWASEVREAMRASGGQVRAAALALEVHERTLYRWLDDPRLRGIPRAGPGSYDRGV